jgi:hypothetical protein
MHNDEYADYRHSKALLSQLYSHLSGTRFGNQIQKIAKVSQEWQQTLYQIARTVRQLVPPDAYVAAVDKYDPTLLHLSQRKGWHFPHRRLLPAGYPPDSEVAIEHLEQLRQRGAGYLVFPSAAFWWLDYYEGFRQHLDGCYRQVWCNEYCIIYQLT